MKKIFVFALVLLLQGALIAQDKEAADKLIDEGVAYHDKGDYEGAIDKYDKALKVDTFNLKALGEKAYSLLSLEKYDESVAQCQLAIKKHPGDEGLHMIYVVYGNALDEQKKTDKSIEVYDEGIKLFPDSYMLHFNRGVSLASVKKYDDAIQSYQNALRLNPRHAGSHNAMGRILMNSKKRIPALLCFCRFMVVEPTSDRAKENLENIKTLLNAGIEKTGKKDITINVDQETMTDTNENGIKKENNFKTVDLALSMSAALHFDKKYSKETDMEQFVRNIKIVCAMLKETQKDNYGFYWDFYAPYFIEMNDKDFVDTYGYIVFASSDDPAVNKWIKAHDKEINAFYDWSKNFSWKSN
jgi:tetratricopeptide (TPR) repeat protein